jgi:hypothetical protein
MAILGVHTAVFGVEDFELSKRFFDDLGLASFAPYAGNGSRAVLNGDASVTHPITTSFKKNSS